MHRLTDIIALQEIRLKIMSPGVAKNPYCIQVPPLRAYNAIWIFSQLYWLHKTLSEALQALESAHCGQRPIFERISLLECSKLVFACRPSTMMVGKQTRITNAFTTTLSTAAVTHH